MHTDGIVLLAVDGALFLGIFVMLVRIQNRLVRLERRRASTRSSARKKSSVEKKD